MYLTNTDVCRFFLLSIMRKMVLLLLLLPLLVAEGLAQKKMLYRRVEKIGESSLLCYYNYFYNELGIREEAVMLLQTGGKVQKFCGLAHYYRDSLALIFNNRPQDKLLLAKESARILNIPGCRKDVQWVMYLNFPHGERTITDRVFTDSFLSKEKNITPSWVYTDDTQTIRGNLCHKATTTLYGRNWIVWFSPEIERPDGPWLLRGLPGLLVLAETDDGKFKFELQKIVKKQTFVLFDKKEYFKADRNKVLQNKRKYYENKARYAKAASVDAHPITDMPYTPSLSYHSLRKIK